MEIRGLNIRCGKYIDKYAINLNKKVSNNDYHGIVGRKNELKQLSCVLLKRTKNNALLLGDAGVGKTALCEEFASMIVKKECDVEFDDAIVLQLDTTGLLSGTAERGSYEENITMLLKELEEENQHYILMIDEVHTIVSDNYVGSGKQKESTLNLSNLLKPLLGRGRLQCIGATTMDEYIKYFAKDKAMVRRFQPIVLNEPTEMETIDILRHIRPTYEEYHRCVISDDMLELCVVLSKKYMYYRNFPDKAIDILDEACSMARMRNESELTKELMYELVSMIFDVHVQEDHVELMEKAETKLYDSIIGQDESIREIVRALNRVLCDVYNPRKPMSSWLFVGPPGTGKTETAKIVSECFFNRPMIRLDMSEYMESFAVSKLIGAPPGYMGYDEGGLLTNAIKRNPYTLILFDEFEKAHTSVQNILLQILEEGEVLDAYGGKINFKNAIVVMTCNNVPTNTNEFGFQESSSISSERSDIVRQLFKPELLNRIDLILYFETLSRIDLKHVVKKNVNAELERLKALTGYEMTSQERYELIERIYNQVNDVRSIRTHINNELLSPMSERMLRLQRYI